MSLWLMKEYNESLEVLLVPMQNEEKLKKMDDYGYPAIFNFYYYLRSHPLLRRRFYVKQKSFQNQRMTFFNENINELNALKDATKKYERKLYFQTAITHLNAGLPAIAFEVLSMLPHYTDITETDTEENTGVKKDVNKNTDMINTGTISLDYGKSSLREEHVCNGTTISNNDNIGWGGGSSMSTNRFADLDEEYKIGISLSSSDEDSDNEKDNETVEVNTKDMTDLDEVDSSAKSKEGNNTFDIIALNLKYMCLIQCIIETLKSLPAKCTQESTKLRPSLSLVLREELDFLHQCCDYGRKDVEDELSPAHVEMDIMEQEIQGTHFVFLLELNLTYLVSLFRCNKLILFSEVLVLLLQLPPHDSTSDIVQY